MRMAPLLPLLLSSIAMPAAAGDYSFCYAQTDSVNCLIQQIEFERSQNALATASVARVEARRARELALSQTHCKSRWSRTPRCMAEKAQRFAAQQNQLAAASIERVNRVRTAEAVRNAEMAGYIARIKAQRQRQLEIEQNKLIEASLAAVEAQKQIRFAIRQNALATASVIRVKIERNRQLALSLSPCKSADDQRPRCLAQRDREFAAEQNKLAAASAARVTAERERAFAAARNAEINRSIAAVARNRAQTIAYNASPCANSETSPRCEAERNRELQLALTHCKTAADTSPRCTEQRDREFHIARNAEIDRSIAAVAAARAREQANTATGNSNTDNNSGISAYGDVIAPLETGALGVLPRPTLPEARPLPEIELRHDISTEPCRPTGTPFGPLHFGNGLDIDATMRPELDRLASLAATCPGMRIEIHGYSDGRSSTFINRSMAQARAQAVADYLIVAGIAPNRLASIGRGALAPVLPYSKSIDPAYGRRVEFLIKDPAMDAAARKVMWDLAELLDPTYVPAVAGLSP